MPGEMRNLDEDRSDLERQAVLDALQHERSLLQMDAEKVRAFYSLTGSSRKNYVEQIADAEAARIKLAGAARAENIRVAADATAGAIRQIGDALAAVPNPQHVLEYLRIQALERIAQSLANGRATKLVVPQSFEGFFTAMTAMQAAQASPADNEQRKGS